MTFNNQEIPDQQSIIRNSHLQYKLERCVFSLKSCSVKCWNFSCYLFLDLLVIILEKNKYLLSFCFTFYVQIY